MIAANFLITWDNILTIMHYPDRKGYDFPSEFEKSIGFEIPEKGDNEYEKWICENLERI